MLNQISWFTEMNKNPMVSIKSCNSTCITNTSSFTNYHQHIITKFTNISPIYQYVYVYIYIFNLSPNSNPYHAKNGTLIRAGRKNPSLPLHPFAVLRSAPCECCGALKGGALEGVGNNPVLRGLTTNHLLG